MQASIHCGQLSAPCCCFIKAPPSVPTCQATINLLPLVVTYLRITNHCCAGLQVRALQPGAERCTEEDAMELMEMILGALGRDAVGLGASMAHPRESEEWRGMSLEEKYEFFAPIWRVMRDDNMTAQQVRTAAR